MLQKILIQMLKMLRQLLLKILIKLLIFAEIYQLPEKLEGASTVET
jgi:hypothetical protein